MAAGVEPSAAPSPSTQKPAPLLDLALAGPLGQYLVATTAGLLMFLFFVRRDESMADGAAQFEMLPGLVHGNPAASSAAALTGAKPRAADGDEDGMPRWLRPSVRTARGIEPDRRHR